MILQWLTTLYEAFRHCGDWVHRFLVLLSSRYWWELHLNSQQWLRNEHCMPQTLTLLTCLTERVYLFFMLLAREAKRVNNLQCGCFCSCIWHVAKNRLIIYMYFLSWEFSAWQINLLLLLKLHGPWWFRKCKSTSDGSLRVRKTKWNDYCCLLDIHWGLSETISLWAKKQVHLQYTLHHTYIALRSSPECIHNSLDHFPFHYVMCIAINSWLSSQCKMEEMACVIFACQNSTYYWSIYRTH